MSTSDLLACLDRLGQPRVLVLGDFILDRYTWGDAERVSQEAPVILLRADHREARLGGAGNVAAMLRGLDAEVTCAGVVGADADGQLVRDLLAATGAAPELLLTDAARPTTVKERFIGRAQGRHPHQILRVDSEVRTPIPAAIESQLSGRLLALIAQHDVILVSDYDKGVCTPSLLRKIIDHCRDQDVPVLVDPIRGADYSRYRGATSMTPNRTEAGLATGVTIDSAAAALEAAKRLKQTLDLDFSIVTLDRDGMALLDAQGHGDLYPTQPRAVYDITGAGDMVLAMIGVAMASGLAPAECVRLGNVAGGLEVEKVGVAVIPRAEIRTRLLADRPAQHGKVVHVDALLPLAEAHRAVGERIVLTTGAFQPLRLAHIQHLEAAARLADVLVVGIEEPSAARESLSIERVSIEDRAGILAALSSVRYVIPVEGSSAALIEKLRPDVVAIAGDGTTEQQAWRAAVESYGGQICFTHGAADGATRPAASPTPAVRKAA